MKKFYLIILLLLPVSVFSQQYELVKAVNPENVFEYTGFTLEYNETTEQALWVAYELTDTEVRGNIKRADNFRSDKNITTGSADLSDYQKSGYDRGHLAPAGDMKWSQKAMSDSFYMSNMSPQVPGFNRGIWKKLEEQVRSWTLSNKNLLVVTGPIIQTGYKTIGSNDVAVPQYYFKVIADITKPDIKAVGFILPNEKSSRSLTEYMYSVDEVERITGLDFFYQLPDDIENMIESGFHTSDWELSTVTTDKKIQNQPVKAENPAIPQKYWINSLSNTRHNPDCRYYGKTKAGYYTDKNIGKPCGTCGG